MSTADEFFTPQLIKLFMKHHWKSYTGLTKGNRKSEYKQKQQIYSKIKLSLLRAESAKHKKDHDDAVKYTQESIELKNQLR